MEVKQRCLITEIKAEDTGAGKSFEAYASTFGNMDSYDDVIMPGAFTETLKKRKPKLAYQHDVTRLPGIIVAAEEDSNGLLVRGEFLNTPLGLQVYEEVKSGAINQMSIGFTTTDAEYSGDGVRLIKAVELYEVSFVTFPANERALVTHIKSEGIKTIRDFEEFLRDAGFSRKDATRLASHGFKTSEEIKRDADISELAETLNNLQQKFKG